jgi:hypothetical protein
LLRSANNQNHRAATMANEMCRNRIAAAIVIALLCSSLLAGGACARTVGETETFHFDGASFNTTCTRVGSHCVIFVQDGVPVDPAVVAGLQSEFDERIYPLDTGTFGAETDVDGEERVYIAIVSGPGTWAGVFDPSSLLSANQRDVFYLDVGSVLQAGLPATAAHEFQHLIHCGHDFDEGYLVDEGCAIYAELLYANFSTENLPEFDDFRQNPGVSLQWTATEYAQGLSPGAHYGASGLWILYLSENYGDLSGDPDHVHFIRDLVEENENGFAGVDTVLARHGYDERSEDIFRTWVVANCLDDRSVDPLYGYESIDFATPVRREASVELGELDLTDGAHSFPPVALPAWSAAYYTVHTGDPANLSFSCEGGCWWHRIDEGEGSVTVVISPLDAPGDAALIVHADEVRKAAREKHHATG